MMTLQAHSSVKVDEVSVTWSVGGNRSGLVNVKLSDERITYSDNDKAIVGELCAVRYLLNDKQVFGTKLLSAAGLRLIVSKGAIKKLAKGKSSKKQFLVHSAFLRRQLEGVELKVCNRLADPGETEVTAVSITDKVIRDDIIESPAMGKVIITQHAVERYAERFSSGNPSYPRASLVKVIQSPELDMFPMPEAVRAHKARKYRNCKDTSELWGHPSSSLKLQVINNANGLRTVVTVFERCSGYNLTA